MTREQQEILRQAIDDAIYYRDPPQKCVALLSRQETCAAGVPRRPRVIVNTCVVS